MRVTNSIAVCSKASPGLNKTKIYELQGGLILVLGRTKPLIRTLPGGQILEASFAAGNRTRTLLEISCTLAKLTSFKMRESKYH